MKRKVAHHRVQDLGQVCDQLRKSEQLKGDVETYLHLRDLQLDAVEDGETCLANNIGRNMKEIRVKYDSVIWQKEIGDL
ncbi:TPA: hypothetical protein U2J49_003403 [Enterobacter roggenkampii]|nr:hypothetical protein [Enterobacter roggenkampii]